MIRRAFASVWLVLVLARCAPEDVVLFELPGGPGAGGDSGGSSSSGGSAGTSNGGVATASGGRMTASGGAETTSGGVATTSGGSVGQGEGTSCFDDDDCPDGWDCQKPECDAPRGRCEPQAIVCEGEPQPVCGCDGVTYWNDCVRRQGGAWAATPGECRAAARGCETAADCEQPNAFCARLYSPDNPCERTGSGTCWVLPDRCESSDQGRWIECLELPLPMPLPPPICVDTCTAIASEQPHFRAPPRAPCE